MTPPEMQDGYFIRRGTSKAPRGFLALEHGLPTTTASRVVIAVARTESDLRIAHPEAFLPEEKDDRSA